MSYAAVDDLSARLGSALYGEIYAGDDGPSVATGDLSAAVAEIDGVLATRYTVPVTAETAAALLKDWAVTLAMERAAGRPAGSAIPEKIKDAAAQVRKYLEMILAGTFQVTGAADAEGGIGAYLLAEADEPDFTRDKMEGF